MFAKVQTKVYMKGMSNVCIHLLFHIVQKGPHLLLQDISEGWTNIQQILVVYSQKEINILCGTRASG